MSTVGLPEFLSDIDIKHQLPACTSNDPRRSTNLQQTRTSNSFPGNDNSGGTFNAKDLIRGGCGDSGVRCDFTIFVPNGTTTDYFQQTMNGQKLFEDRNRLRYVSVFNTKYPLVFLLDINIFNVKYPLVVVSHINISNTKYRLMFVSEINVKYPLVFASHQCLLQI